MTCASPTCNNDPILCPGREVCEPQPPFFMIYIDGFCVLLFSIDYLTRITLSPWIPARYDDCPNLFFSLSFYLSFIYLFLPN